MKDKYLIGLATLVNGSMLGYEDTSCVNEYKQWIEDYVNHSEQEIQSLKEVIKDLRKAIGRKEETIFELQDERSECIANKYDSLTGELQQENKILKDKLSKMETLIMNHNSDTGDIYYKYNSRFLKSELKQRILDILNEVE